MGKTDTIFGLWWVLGKEKEPAQGEVSITEDFIVLTVTLFRSLSTLEILRDHVNSDIEIPPVIHGRNGANETISLLGCVRKSKTWNSGAIIYEVCATAMVKGLELQSIGEICLKSCSFNLRYLEDWFGDTGIETKKLDDGQIAWTLPEPSFLRYSICEGVTMRIVRMPLSSATRTTYEFFPSAKVNLIFDQPKSLQEMFIWVQNIGRLFSFLMGDDVSPVEFAVTIEDPWAISTHPHGGQVIRPGKINPPHESDADHALRRFSTYDQVAGQLETILQRWHDLSECLKAVVDLFAAVVFGKELPVEVEFLFLAQAVEVYHTKSPRFDSNQLSRDEHASRVDKAVSATPDDVREWAKAVLQKANYKPLKDKLREVIQSWGAPTLRLYPDIEKAVDRISYNRNHLTHYSGSGPRLFSDQEMYFANQSLKALLWTIFLLELGLSGPPIESVFKNLVFRNVPLSQR